MKPSHTGLFFLAICAIYLSSCQKDFVTENAINRTDSTNVPGLAGDSIYLSRYYYYETSSNINDTGTRRTYLYDNLKRVININDTSYEPGANYPTWYTTDKFFYNGNDTLPYKRVSIGKSPSGGYISKDTVTNFYTFNANAQLISDSSIHSAEGYFFPTYNFYRTVSITVQTISYAGNIRYGRQILSVRENVGTALTPYIRLDTATVDAAGNIVAASNRITDSLSNDYSYHNATFIYDNKFSPFFRMNIKKVQAFFSHSDFYQDVTAYSDFVTYNNILKVHENEIYSSGGTTGAYSYDADRTGWYNYNPNGLLLLTVDNTNPNYTSKESFFYKSLP